MPLSTTMATDKKLFLAPITLERREKREEKSHGPASPEIPLMINALKKLYKTKLLPFEERYSFAEFSSPYLKDAYFDAKPLVLLVGGYSVGKTTFIRYLLERDFPGVRIGPEPTTDRFMIITEGPTDRTIPGNALVADKNRPWTALTKFGMKFLNKFECAECKSPILESVTFLDTPGILSGDKQREGRGYDFPTMVEFFAEMTDRILLLFDAHKLDISDEFKDTIDKLRPFDEKIRIVLNKADIETQQLVRVYGALMWSLGKVFNTPEVIRVYIGSFWDKPLKCKDNVKLLELERQDLIGDLRGLPRNVAVRKVNEMIKRARRAKVHYYIVDHLRTQFGVFGKGKKQAKLLATLGDEFKKVQTKHKVPKGDFPPLQRFKKTLSTFDISKFPKMKKDTLANLEQLLNTDVPKLMTMIPTEMDEGGESKDNKSNPFDMHGDDVLPGVEWAVNKTNKQKYMTHFAKLPQTGGKVKGTDLMSFIQGAGLPGKVNQKLWAVSDIDKDGKLDIDEFCVCFFIIETCKKGMIPLDNSNPPVPIITLPDALIPPSKRHLYKAMGT